MLILGSAWGAQNGVIFGMLLNTFDFANVYFDIVFCKDFGASVLESNDSLGDPAWPILRAL